MKLRLLNGSHSTLAYLGYLAGYETISDAMADPDFVRLVQGLMDEEVTPTLAGAAGADLAAYKRALLERFANPALQHRTWQIAMDGSQKLPQRLLGTIRDRFAAGAPIAAAGARGRGLDALRHRHRRAGPPDRRARPAVPSGCAPSLMRPGRWRAGWRRPFWACARYSERIWRRDPRFTKPVTDALDSLFQNGARAAVRGLVSSG